MTDQDSPDQQADTERRAARALLDASRMLMGITLRAVAAAPVPLTVPQHRVLLTVADGPLRVGALADDLGVNQSNASRIVDRLAGQGLVRRARDAEDGRAWLVELTPEGRRVLQAVQDHRLTALLEVIGRLPDGAGGVVEPLAELVSAASRAD